MEPLDFALPNYALLEEEGPESALLPGALRLRLAPCAEPSPLALLQVLLVI